MDDPSPLRTAPRGMARKVLGLAGRLLLRERDLEAKASRLDRLIAMMNEWLGRDDLIEGVRREGEDLRDEAARDLGA